MKWKKTSILLCIDITILNNKGKEIKLSVNFNMRTSTVKKKPKPWHQFSTCFGKHIIGDIFTADGM